MEQFVDDYVVGVRKEDHDIEAKANSIPLSPEKKLLRETKIGSLFPEERNKIVFVDSKTSVSDAFKTLIDHYISAAPVFDASKKKYIGFVGLNDIVSLIAKNFSTKEVEESGEDLTLLLKSKNDLQSRKAFEIVDFSEQNPFFPIDQGASLQDAIDLIVRWKVRRLPVINSEGVLVSLLTQSQIISFLQKNIACFSFSSKRLSELSIGTQEVITAHASDKAIDAFKKISEKGVQGIAILDENEKLVGNLSTTDVKVIGHSAKLLPTLILPVSHFNKFIPENPVIPGPITVTELTTFEELMFKIVVSKVHRVFVVKDEKLSAVISLLDLLIPFSSTTQIKS